ncbi:MAG: DUF4350 domain-containing protein [Fimbriimonadaceae bacterium]
MKTRTLVTIGLAILGLASIFLITGRDAASTMPSVQDFGASGTSAFAELIKRDGYQVRLEREVRPKLEADALMVLPMVPVQPDWATFVEERTGESEEEEPADEEANQDEQEEDEQTNRPPRKPRAFWREAVLEHLRQGGKVLVIEHEGQGVRKVAEPTRVELWDGTRQDLTIRDNNSLEFLPVLPNMPAIARARTVQGEQVVASEAFPAKGRIVFIQAGEVLENRALDKHDNAAFALGWIREMQKSGGEVVFYEGALGNVSSKGLIESIGPWANTARWQFILLLAVVAYASGVMFGRPILDRIPQRSSQHLMEAFGSALSRGDHNRFVMERELIQAKSRIEKALGMAPGSDWNQLLPILTPTLAEHIQAMQAQAAFPGKKMSAILQLIATLESELQAFESQVRSGRDAEFRR